MQYIGIDLGGTNIKYGLIDKLGNVVESNSMPTPKTKNEVLLAIKTICEYYPNTNGLGISCPGIIRDDGLLITAGALFDCYGINLIDEVAKFYPNKISVENDVNCAALAELWTGEGRNHKNFIVITVGTGIGGALVIDSKLYRGSNFMAGEFGFMKMNPHIKNRIEETMLSQNGSIYGGIVSVYSSHTGKLLDGKEIFDLALTDKVAKKCVENFYDCLSTAIFNLIVSFDPEIVLVGGEISKRSEFIGKLNEKVYEIKLEYENRFDVIIPQIKSCTHYNYAGMIGAVAKLLK